MIEAVRFAGHVFLAAEMEILIPRITERPAAHIGTEIKDAHTPGLLFGLSRFTRFGLLGPALDRGRAFGQAQTMSLADHGVFTDAQLLTNFCRGPAFVPQFGQLFDFFQRPAHLGPL